MLLFAQFAWAHERLLSGDTVGVRDSLKAFVARHPGNPKAAQALLWLEILGTDSPLVYFKALKLFKEKEFEALYSLNTGDTSLAPFLEILKAKALAEEGKRNEALRLLGEVSKGRGLAAAWGAWEAYLLSGDEKFLKDLIRRFPKTAYGAMAREELERQ